MREKDIQRSKRKQKENALLSLKFFQQKLVNGERVLKDSLNSMKKERKPGRIRQRKKLNFKRAKMNAHSSQQLASSEV